MVNTNIHQALYWDRDLQTKETWSKGFLTRFFSLREFLTQVKLPEELKAIFSKKFFANLQYYLLFLQLVFGKNEVFCLQIDYELGGK